MRVGCSGEHDFVLGRFRRLVVDAVEFGQRDVAFAVFGRADLAFDRIAGAQIEAPDLRGRDINVVGAGEVGGIRRAQETEAVGQDFQRTVAENRFPLFGMAFQDGKKQILFTEPVGVLDTADCGHLE